jgi:hypothetical protein
MLFIEKQQQFQSTGTRGPMNLQPNARQQEPIKLAGHLARERFACRAATYDLEASFPDTTYCLASKEMARSC